MKLLTEELKRKFEKYPLYSQDGKGENAVVVCKFFLGTWTWYALEFDGQDTFFGLVVGLETEYGYFSLSELSRVRNTLGLGVERDMYFKPCTLAELSKTDEDVKEFMCCMYAED